MDRKMAFYELHEGRLGVQFQDEFEKAQQVCFEKNAAVKVSLTVTVFPPEKGNDGYGKVQYQIARTDPKAESPELFTRLNGCFITSDNRDIALVDQTKLEFPQEVKRGA
jgi:hypothetical protein